MLKRALLAVTMIAGSTAIATTVDLDPAPTSASDSACRSAAATDAGCALRIADPAGEAVLPPADLDVLPPPSPALDLAPLRPPRDTALDFKDAATEPVSVLHASLGLDTSRPLMRALLALAALVVLLRQRRLWLPRRPTATG